MAGNSLKKGRYTEYGNKIGLYSNSRGGFIQNDPEVVLNFPFKDTVLEAGMSKEDVGREERFLHIGIDGKDIDTLEEPKVLTDFRYIDKNGEKPLTVDSDVRFFDAGGNLKQNLLIKGNNLLALCTLRKCLASKVKLVYIDPPYNTGNDSFRYNDRFNHSAWLTFMKNRLEGARDLLSDDGVIIVQCDDSEQAYLKVLMDEVLGRNNFVANLIWEKKTGASDARHIATITEYAIVFSKDVDNVRFTKNTKAFDINRYKHKDKYVEERGRFYYDNLDRGTLGYHVQLDYGVEAPDGTVVFPNGRKEQLDDGWRWKWSKKKLDWGIDNGFIEVVKVPTGEWKVKYKIYLNVDNNNNPIKKSSPHKNLISGTLNTHAATEIQALFGERAFSTPKPEGLIQKMIDMATQEGDIVLDFCLGSGTTSAVAHKMNRRWVGVEQMDYIESVAKERLKKVVAGEQGGISRNVGWSGGGSFVYFELKKYNQEYIDRIMRTGSLKELEDIYVDMRNNAFLKFWFDRKDFERDEDFRNLKIEERKQKLVDVLDENQLYLNYADMDDSRHNVPADEKALTNRFYRGVDHV